MRECEFGFLLFKKKSTSGLLSKGNLLRCLLMYSSPFGRICRVVSFFMSPIGSWLTPGDFYMIASAYDFQLMARTPETLLNAPWKIKAKLVHESSAHLLFAWPFMFRRFSWPLITKLLGLVISPIQLYSNELNLKLLYNFEETSDPCLLYHLELGKEWK